MSFIIKRNTILPCKKTSSFSTINDYQNNFKINVFEGERQFTKDNCFLGTFTLNNITQAPKGEVSMLVTFEIDEKYSLLKITAKEEKNKNFKQFEIKRVKRNEEEIEKIIQEGINMKIKDMEERKKIKEKMKYKTINTLSSRQDNIISNYSTLNSSNVPNKNEKEKEKTHCYCNIF